MLLFILDAMFDVWNGCYLCSDQDMALLCCVAINGYHGCSAYEWRRVEDNVFIGRTPLMYYIAKTGNYVCRVITHLVNSSEDVDHHSYFTISS